MDLRLRLFRGTSIMQSYNLQRWQGPLGRGARESRDSVPRWSTVLARVLSVFFFLTSTRVRPVA